jgi:hypothetical protein
MLAANDMLPDQSATRVTNTQAVLAIQNLLQQLVIPTNDQSTPNEARSQYNAYPTGDTTQSHKSMYYDV